MKFDLSKVYSPVNADELNEGDIVIVADNLHRLIEKVTEPDKYSIRKICEIKPTYYESRFQITTGEMFILAYLVKRKKEE